MSGTALAVCHNQRIHQHKVFAGIAARGKTSVDDRQPVPALARRLFGKLFGDKGYISHKLVAHLLESCQVQLVTFARTNMQGCLLHHDDVLLLRKRAIIETINDQLKNISQIEHSRHHSPLNFVVNLLAGLIAYALAIYAPPSLL